MSNFNKNDHEVTESKQLETQLKEKINSLEQELKQYKETLENLEYNTLKLKSHLKNLSRYLKILFWLLLGLFGCGIAFILLMPPVVIGLWIIFAAILIVIAIFYYLIKLTFSKFD